jgi:sortase (surface protein transpeptidase)
MPERITIGAIGVDAAVRGVVSAHQQGLWVIVPPMATNADLQRAYWWSEHAAPASPSNGTAYIYGHACSHYALCAFNRLRELAKGDLVTVTTVRGALTYRVAARPVRLAKTAAGIGASSIYDYGAVNRLVLITCGYAPDGSSPWNWVVITQLTAATPRGSPN